MNRVNVTRDEFRKALLKAANVQDLIFLVNEISNLVYSKNQDYGDAWQRYGIFTPLIRLNDKILRLENLADGHMAMIDAEGIKDTLEDIVGYATLALMWLEKNETKGLTLADNDPRKE